MATANESGYGAFLPRYDNDFIDREALRGQMTKQAAYLTEMDQIYAQLEERAREFEQTLGQKESQFSRKLQYEYDALEQQAEQFDKNLSLGWYGAETERQGVRSQERIAQAQANLAARRQFLDEERFDYEKDLDQQKFDLVSKLYQSTTEVSPFSAGSGVRSSISPTVNLSDLIGVSSRYESAPMDITSGEVSPEKPSYTMFSPGMNDVQSSNLGALLKVGEMYSDYE